MTLALRRNRDTSPVFAPEVKAQLKAIEAKYGILIRRTI
jgi:hypothetical protein